MRKHLVIPVLLLMLAAGLTGQDQKAIPQLRYESNHSLTWEEAISFYSSLAQAYPEAQLKEMGMTDAGRPLHLFIISGDKEFDPVETIRKERQSSSLITASTPANLRVLMPAPGLPLTSWPTAAG